MALYDEIRDATPQCREESGAGRTMDAAARGYLGYVA